MQMLLFVMDSKMKSPCIRYCCLNDEDICLGCFRSLDEIKQWQSASNKQRQKILDVADKRKQVSIIMGVKFKL